MCNMQVRLSSRCCIKCGNTYDTTTFEGHRCFGLRPDTDELVRLRKYWGRKANYGLPFEMTGPEMIQLLDDAGITVYDIGIGPGKWVLARYNDRGGYRVGNCRFVPWEVNKAEGNNIAQKNAREVEILGKVSCVERS